MSTSNYKEGKRNHSEMMETCNDQSSTELRPLVPHHSEMMSACTSGNHNLVLSLLDTATSEDSSGLNRRLLASQQDPEMGFSPLILAATGGHLDIVRTLLEEGAPWNALDRNGKCAGNYATENEHWEVVNTLVDAGTKAELILGASIRLQMQMTSGTVASKNENSMEDEMDVSEQPCTKPDYIQANVRYDAANTILLDNDNDAVMMEWERPLMEAHANFLAGNAARTSDDGSGRKRVLNVGFGLGIIDTFIQSHNPSVHVIIEAHPTVYKKMIADGWNKRDNVRICFGRWQDELPKLIQERVEFDGIFYDTYGEVRILCNSTC